MEVPILPCQAYMNEPPPDKWLLGYLPLQTVFFLEWPQNK